MAAGDVTVQIIAAPFTTATVDTAVTAMRNTANDKWLMASCANQLIIVNIEEA